MAILQTCNHMQSNATLSNLFTAAKRFRMRGSQTREYKGTKVLAQTTSARDSLSPTNQVFICK